MCHPRADANEPRRLGRRALVRAAGLAGAGAVLHGNPAVAAPRAAAGEPIRVSATVTQPTGEYLELRFAVPSGVNRVDVSVTTDAPAAVGAGLFDHRGAGYQSPGFRGIYGEERRTFFVAAHAASQSFIPGPIVAGTWTVLIPVFRANPGTRVTAEIRLTFGAEHPAFVPGPAPGVVRATPGWYRGDLHCHTPESSDAWASGSALTPRQWADEARRVGLDFLALTDHNVVSQNFSLAADAGPRVLLMPGEEMTNWFHGHATVSGISPGDWLDWRQTPFGQPLPTGRDGARVQDFLRVARDLGGYVSAAHPLAATLRWDFFADGAVDPAARTDGIEVWTGPFQPDDEAALVRWDELLAEGWRIFANGGSDLHGVNNSNGFVYGTPTTVVHATALSKPAIVAALKAGRSFVTRRPRGVEAYLSATGPDGQRQITGGSIYGQPGDLAKVEVVVRDGGGMRLVLLRDGVAVSVTPLRSDNATVTLDQPIGAGGYVRAEVRDRPEVDPARPLAGRTDMETLTNPVFLVTGEPPPGQRPDHTRPPRRRASGRPPP